MAIERPSPICVYCWQSPAVTSDHVFARKFFVGGREHGIPEVPSCRRCNRAKSRVEGYLMTVMMFGGRHRDAANNIRLHGQVRMAGNRKIARRLAREASWHWTQENGVVRRVMAVPFEWSKLEELGVYLARGLAWHHWGVRLGAGTFVEAHLLEPRVLREYARLLAAPNARATVEVTLPGNTFRYRGVQAADREEITLWGFEVYGGMQTMAGRALNVGAMTGPDSSRARAIAESDRLAAWRSGTRLHRP